MHSYDIFNNRAENVRALRMQWSLSPPSPPHYKINSVYAHDVPVFQLGTPCPIKKNDFPLLYWKITNCKPSLSTLVFGIMLLKLYNHYDFAIWLRSWSIPLKIIALTCHIIPPLSNNNNNNKTNSGRVWKPAYHLWKSKSPLFLHVGQLQSQFFHSFHFDHPCDWVTFG